MIPIDPGMPTITGTPYYVDASTTGTQVGTIDNPFRTLAQAQSQVLNPGDALLFKRGETWIATNYFAFDQDGDVSADVLYGVYGTGEHPVITSITEQTLTWNDIGGNVWESNEDVVYITRLYRNGSEIMKANTGNTLGDTIPDLCEWDRNDNINLKLRVYNNPSGDTFKFATLEYTGFMFTHSYITMYGIDMQGGRESGLYIKGVQNITFSYMKFAHSSYYGVRCKVGSQVNQNVTFDSCIVDANWNLNYKEIGIDGSSSSGAKEGIFVSGNTTNFTYTNNYFKNNSHSALNLYADDGTMINTVIKHNYFTSPDIPYGGRIAAMGDHQGYEIAYNVFKDQFGARIQVEGTGGHIHHNIWSNIQDSLIDNTGVEGSAIRMGDWYSHAHDNIVENNIFYDVKPNALDIGGTGTFGEGRGLEAITIQNNIFLECNVSDEDRGSPVYLRNLTNSDNAADITVKNNISFAATDTMFGKVGDDDKENVTDFETTLNSLSDDSIGSDNITSDPSFIDLVDFILASGSPCVGTGLDPISAVDMNGVTIIQGSEGSGYDIGIYNQGTEPAVAAKAGITDIKQGFTSGMLDDFKIKALAQYV